MTALHRFRSFQAALATFVAGAVLFFGLPLSAAEDPVNNQIAAGKYVYNLSGCEGCHTDKKNKGAKLAGGRRFETDFGTFTSPNITPDNKTGIGKWSFGDFENAMRDGVAADGSHYYPAFPYPSYAFITDDDLRHLWGYLKTVPAVQQQNRGHELSPPFSLRVTLGLWKWLNVDNNPLAQDSNHSEAWNRGRYIATALSHCQECHTPRDFIGGLKKDMAYGGTQRNPEGIRIPNITSDPETGIGKWGKGDLDLLFKMGMLPDTDFVSGVMAEMVTHATSNLTPADRAALIEYIESLNPVHNRIEKSKAGAGKEDWE